MKKIGKRIGGFTMCLLEILVGILLLIDPAGFTSAIIIGAGWIMVLIGAGSAVKYFFTAPEEAAKGQYLLKGLVALLAGWFCAFHSGWFLATFPVITMVYGVTILITGLGKVQWTVDFIRRKNPKWFLGAASAVASIVCGIVIASNPFHSAAVLWIFTGVSLIAEAVLDFAAVLLGGKAGKDCGDPAQDLTEVEGEAVGSEEEPAETYGG